MTWHSRLMVGCAAALLWGSPVCACPVCESETGGQVRAGIFDADFGYNLLGVLLPFPLLLAVVALIHFGLPWPRRAPGRAAPPAAGVTHEPRPRRAGDEP